MVIEILRQEHRNIEKLLFVLERELGVFARGDRPDYEVVHAVIAYFQVYPDEYHHPLEDLVFDKLKLRDRTAVAHVGDLAADHRRGAERLRRVAQAVEGVLAGQEFLRQSRQRHHSRLHRARTAPYGHGRAQFLSCRDQSSATSGLGRDCLQID